MEQEFELYQQVKKYLEGLGYPSNTIIPEYVTSSGSRTDIAVKNENRVLVAIALKSKLNINASSQEEIAFHPITRQLQKQADELGAKYYVVSDGKKHIWLKTGANGRPEVTVAIIYANLSGTTLSNAEFTKFLLEHVFEYVKNFPITGDVLYDNSIILYLRLVQELRINSSLPIDLTDILDGIRQQFTTHKSIREKDIIIDALERLGEVNLLENKSAVLEFIDECFQEYRREWNVPRWLGDLMVKVLLLETNASIVDMFARNGTLTSAAYLNHYNNVRSFYVNQTEIYWIKIQQILSSNKEQDLTFEPGLLRGELAVIANKSIDAVLLAPPFNLKFNSFQGSYLASIGVNDSDSLFLEAAFNGLKENGKVVSVVKDGFLLSSTYEKARRYFKENGTIEALISLPQDTFRPYSSVKTSLIVLRKDIRSQSRTKTFFASIENSPRNNFLNCREDININSILENYESFKNFDSVDSVSKNGFVIDNITSNNFHFSKYWYENQKGKTPTLDTDFIAIPLKELVVQIERGSAIVTDSNNPEIPFVTPASIRSLLLKTEELSYTSTKKLPKGKIKTIDKDDIIVNIIGPYRGKAALATSEVKGFPINRHLISIKANLDLIIPQYLVIALNSKYVQDQFLDKSSGAVIHALNLASFEEIYLPVPNIKQQEQIYSEYSKLLDELAKLKNRESEIQSKLKNKLNGLGKGGDLL